MTGPPRRPDRAGRSVVICDDRAEIRASLRTVLGHEPGLVLVDEAWDLDSCTTAVRQHRPDVLILDVNIPGGGVAAARTARLISPRTRIVAYSGREEPTVAEAMLAAGCDAYVIKSGRIRPLLDAVLRVDGAGGTDGAARVDGAGGTDGAARVDGAGGTDGAGGEPGT